MNDLDLDGHDLETAFRSPCAENAHEEEQEKRDTMQKYGER